MLCQLCHKNTASIRYAEVVDGTVTDLDICSECLERRQSGEEGGFELATPSPFVHQQHAKASPLIHDATPTDVCTSCQTALQTIIDEGEVGCAECYSSFPVQVESLLEGIHQGLNHRGKSPQVDDVRARIHSELQTKRSLLKVALAEENYEEAAVLRDNIQRIESGLSAAAPGAN